MSKPNIITEAERYCETAQISLSTLALRVLNNSRYFDRLVRRAEKEREDAARLRSYMEENPVQQAAE
jgi:hypothetical protein